MRDGAGALYAASDMYQLLSIFMFRTERDLARALLDGGIEADARGILAELGVEDPKADSLVTGFRPEACEDVGEDEIFHLVRKDFTHLFSNPSFSVVRIHESEFLGEAEGKNARNMSVNSTARDAKSRYAKLDASLMGDAKDQPDHMGLELRFMQILRTAQAAAVEAGDAESASTIEAEAKSFMADHLANWASAFFESVEAEAQTAAYRSVGMLGRAFMMLELSEA